MNRPLFSILHTSARPEKWREIYDAWIKAAVNPEQVEYVLCVDERWGFKDPEVQGRLMDWSYERHHPDAMGGNNIVWNDGRRCYVDGVNTAAKASTGRILIVNADDQYPCEGWDEQLFAEIRLHYMIADHDVLLGRDFVVEVSTGTPQEHERGILVMPILSRARYERLGYVFFPEYESMYADNEFCEHARQDGVIIDARHLLFPHRHPLFDATGKWKQPKQLDAQYDAQNRPEAYQLGEALIKTRRSERFDPSARHNIEKRAEQGSGLTIALCISGETFRWEWVQALRNLDRHFERKGFQVWNGHEYTSNVFVTREQIRKCLMPLEPKADLFFWFDDDNPVPTPEQFDLLLKDLEDNPDVDGVTGWCWIYNTDKGVFYPSCGTWSPDGMRWRAFDPVFFPCEQAPRPVETTGFPCFLMRRSALEKAGERPFLPIIDDSFDQGLSGEDLAFCSRAQAGGAKFLVDPRVRVRHLKICDAVPNVPRPQDLVEPKVAVMMRVRNEARWIGRCINSVIPLAGENVFVMDDESTDDTLEIARATGVNVYSDQFPGEPLDEIRDKEWLVTQVKAACDPDWILCIDGDEELEPDGADMIRRVLSANPNVDVFSLGFLFLWDSVDQIRMDGRYATLGRESLFRAKAGISFRSYYDLKITGEQNAADPKCHVGLHCGNAPVSDGRKSPLNVNLLHYGYLFREDRLRKYRWYRQIDPDNIYEDNYRHMVIGDLPELPADSKTEYGGPLKLVKLTNRMIPRFVMPGPLRDEPQPFAEKSTAANSDSGGDAIPGATIPPGYREECGARYAAGESKPVLTCRLPKGHAEDHATGNGASWPDSSSREPQEVTA